MPVKPAVATTLERLREAAAKTTKTMRVVVDHEKAELAEAVGLASDLREAMLDEASVKMTFRSIGRKAYVELVDRHTKVVTPATPPVPTDEPDVEEVAPQLDYETFIPELVAACCIDPVMTVDETTEILDGWSAIDVTELYVTCMQLCNKTRVGELGKGSSQT